MPRFEIDQFYDESMFGGDVLESLGFAVMALKNTSDKTGSNGGKPIFKVKGKENAPKQPKPVPAKTK